MTSDTYTHPLNSVIGQKSFRVAEVEIKASQNRDICWRTLGRDGEQSCIGGLQLFSDKSQTSLKAGALSFYPLHVTLVNFLEDWRRQHICEGRTVTAYLPVGFLTQEKLDISTGSGKRKKRVTRLELLRALHECVEFVLKPLSSKALTGASFTTSDLLHYRVHFMLSSYIADLPEAEDMCSVKRGSRTFSPCHRCLVSRDQLAMSTKAPRRRVSETLQVLDKVKDPGSNKTAVERCTDLYIFPPLLYSPILDYSVLKGSHTYTGFSGLRLRTH